MMRNILSLLPAAAVAALMSTGVVLPSGPAYAQEGEERETRRGRALSEPVFRRLGEAQEKAEAEDWQGALAILNQVRGMPRLTSYETAQLYNFFGFIYFGLERYNDSIEAYRNVLRQEDIDDGMRENITYTLAQLYFTTEQWAQAAELVRTFLETARNPAPDPFILLGSAYYQMEDYRSLIEPIERAIAIAQQRGTEDREQWWLLLRVAFYETRNLPRVIEVLETLVRRWPRKEYWVQLSAIYGEMDQQQRQLAAFAAAYDQGLLDSNLELLQLANLFLASGAPYRAARVLSQGMEDGIVERDERNYRLLSQAWAAAREDERAIDPLRRAAGMSRDGELDVRLAQIYQNLGRWSDCIESARTGLQKGRVGREDLAQIVLGTCLFENGQLNDAKTAFNRAAQDQRSAQAARQWIQFVDSEIERRRRNEESLRAVGIRS
ncbi:MAG: hypothetical protein JJT85_05625 [Chromatiales bacterium]|nr:hypothetical protein [Chromatiales bacterium]